MADELDALLERVADDGLRSELLQHIGRLRRKRQFGLVFESHLPERVRLPDHPIRRGSQVVRRNAPLKATPQEVVEVNGATVALDADGETEEVARDDLVVVAEFPKSANSFEDSHLALLSNRQSASRYPNPSYQLVAATVPGLKSRADDGLYRQVDAQVA